MPEKGSAEELLDANAQGPLDAMRHSSAHVMAEAVMDLFPGTKLGIGPAIKDGFYYDFDLPRALVPEDLAAIEARMRESIAADHPFVRKEWDPDEGRAFLEQQGQSYKVEILDDLRTAARSPDRRPPVVSTYQQGPFIDLCRGPHVASTGKIGPFKLLSFSGAYWRGQEDRPMLQRIYGTAWDTQEELDLYLWRREEARKRDHRRLGVALDLFSFHDVSPGSAFWHPKGQKLWRTLERRMRELQERRGYQEISTPILVHKKLWEQSGHWDMYGDNMFRVESEGQTFSLKPMNCPESTFIYKTRVRSYRDLPLRFNEYGRLHRNERSGALSGLTRVRHFIQDDAHIFVRPDQLSGEIQALLGEVAEAYSWFGLVPRFAFATRPDKALGDPEAWARAEGLIKEALDTAGVSYVVKPKDGTFYAPKIDIYIDDALGREWQMATIQVDLMMLPERFDLTLHRRARAAATAAGHPPRHLRLAGAVHRHPRGALRGRVPVLVRAGPGGGRAHRRPPQRGGRELAGVLRSRGHPGRGRRLLQPDAEQDPGGPGAEGALHAGAGRPGDRGRTAAARTRAGEQQPALDWEMPRRPTRAPRRRPTPA